MVDKIRKLLKWGKSETSDLHLPVSEEQHFVLRLDDIAVGELSCAAGVWTFRYTRQFKQLADRYHPIVGFPDLEKVYHSKTLWPFFLVRIPGLGQPAVQEILRDEQIDADNEAALLKRFGKKTLANPFTLSVG